jgi:hypothetical protein
MKIQTKSIAPTILVFMILALGFLILIPIPKVKAATPTMSFIAEGFCGNPCQISEINEFGAIGGFNPSTHIGNGLVDEVLCQPGGNINLDPGSQQFNAVIPTFSITSITDNVGDVWAGIPLQFNGGGNSFGEYIWYTNIITTGATTLTITLNTTPGQVNTCVFDLWLITTGISVNNYNGVPGFVGAGTGVFFVGSKTLNLASETVINPTNTINFIVGWTNATGVGTPGFGTTITNISPVTTLRTIAACLNPCIAADFYYQYISSAFVSGYNVAFAFSSMSPGNKFGVGLSVVSFNLGVTGSSNCSNQSCGVVGGGSTLDSTTSFSLIANTTYYYTGTTSTGGLTIQNITSKIAAYTNGNSGKSIDTYLLGVYSLNAGSSFPGAVLNSGNPLVRIFNINGTISTGQTNQFIHGGTLNLVIAPDTTYAVSIISKFSGLSIYHTINSEPMNYTTDGTFSGATWKPPYNIVDKATSPFNLYLFWYGITTPNLLTTTTVTTDLTTCAVSSTCTANTVLVWTTTTSTINNLQGGTGGIAEISNLITYWPIWLLPMFFIPFGIQGILVGFIFGVIVGGVLGIIPLWAAFVLALLTLYLLSKRF